MRILLAQNMVHMPSHGGASKSNRILMEQLARRGHACHVVAPAAGSALTLRWSVDELADRVAAAGATVSGLGGSGLQFTHAGVMVTAVAASSTLPRTIIRVARDFRPDRILVPTDDPGGMILAAAEAGVPGRTIYMIHTIQQLPFGPDAFYPSASATALVRKAAGVVSVSDAGADYAERYAGMTATVVRPDIYGSGHAGKRPELNGFTTLVNASVYKGLDLFLEMARSSPEHPFLAVKSWGTTEDDLRRLLELPNVEVRDPVDDIDDIFRRTRVLVMPSVWDETFGYTCVEAMLRGIPVLAGDIGGLPEAKLGVPYLLPVRRVRRYEDDPGRHAPVAEVPAQPVEAWLAAHRRLLDPNHFEDISQASRRAATEFVQSLDPLALETYLERGLARRE
jgi:glycosyltransferase involved in cell wall biosynthesis